MPLDPAREWLAAGITGLSRGREWDAIATVEGAGEPGDELRFVALADGELVPESGDADPAPFAAALRESIAPPYRALAVRRPELWAVGAVEIRVQRLDPDPHGNDLELTQTDSGLELSIDGMPADPARAAALERIASASIGGPYSARAHRIRRDLWELSVLRL